MKSPATERRPSKPGGDLPETGNAPEKRPMTPDRILVFYGSHRSDRMGVRLAEFIVAPFSARGDVAEPIDAKAVGLPMLDRMSKEHAPGSAPAAMEALAAKIGAADAFVFVAGEYCPGGPRPPGPKGSPPAAPLIGIARRRRACRAKRPSRLSKAAVKSAKSVGGQQGYEQSSGSRDQNVPGAAQLKSSDSAEQQIGENDIQGAPKHVDRGR
jgi:hypothetical protein